MVQIGVGTLLGIGVTILLGMIVALYKVSSNIATVSQNVSRMNDNLGTKLESLNQNISEMSGELRRISETTTRVETKFNGDTTGVRNSEVSGSSPDYETDGATEVTTPEAESMPGGEFRLADVGKTVRIDTKFRINTNGEEECGVEISFPSELVIDTRKMKSDLDALSRGLIGTPKKISTPGKTVGVVFSESDMGVIEDWIDAAVRLLDNEGYYERIGAVFEDIDEMTEEELEEEVDDVLSDVDEIENAVDDVLDSDTEPSEGEGPDGGDFTI